MTRLDKCIYAKEKGFKYFKESGVVKTPRGDVLKKTTKNGYLMICFRDENKKMFYLLAHHFAWFIVYNNTVSMLDHINRNKKDNKISNLRQTNHSKNAMNMSNVKGYYYSKRDKRFISYIMVNNKRKQLGCFLTEEEASNCYLINKNKYHII